MTQYENPFGAPHAATPTQGGTPPGYGQPTPGGQPAPGYPQGGYAQTGYSQPGYPPGTAPGPGGPYGGPPKRSNNMLLIIAIAVLAVIAVGTIGFVVLGGGDDDEGGDEGTTEARTDLTLADLEPALLAAGDVPEGFESVTWEDGDADDDTLSPDQIDGSPECQEVLERFSMSDGARQETGAQFEAENGASMENTLSVAIPNDVTVDEVREGINTCGTFTYDDGESAGQITMSAEPYDGVGDSALFVSMLVETSAEGYDISVEMNGILWDRAGVHSSVSYTGGFEDDALSGSSLESLPIDQEALQSAASAVDAKLQPIVEG